MILLITALLQALAMLMRANILQYTITFSIL